MLDEADNTYSLAFTDHGFMNECERGVTETSRIWWVQAEALLGFLNVWERIGEARYADAVQTQWAYIRDHLCDKRPDGEWFERLDEHAQPSAQPIVEPWKCPYYNGRMYMEAMRRNPNL